MRASDVPRECAQPLVPRCMVVPQRHKTLASTRTRMRVPCFSLSHASTASQGQKSRSGGGKDQYLERLKNIGVFDNVVVRANRAKLDARIAHCFGARAGVLEAL